MKCRTEELPFLAEYARDNFMRDKADFVNNSAEYDKNFLLKFDPQLKLVNEVAATSMLVAQQKAITKQIGKHYESARNWVNKVENYAKKASAALVTDIHDFGFKGIRNEIRVKNDEGVIKKLGEMLQHADANKMALEPKGFTPAFRTSLKTFIDTFETDIKSQIRKIDERKSLVKNNKKEFETLWKMITDDILETGKVIYKEVNKERLKDYTYSELIKKVRLARKKEEEDKQDDSGGAKG
jgi:hypothetical protein